MPRRLRLAKRHVLPRASDTWVGIMYPSESGTRDRVLGPAHLAAASFGIGVPIVTAGILLVAFFSPGLWKSLPLVILAGFLGKPANLLPVLRPHRRPPGARPFPRRP